MSANLLTIDDDSLGKILEFVDFKGIMTLRNVCRDLRNVIDDKKPDINLENIMIKIHAGYEFSIYTERGWMIYKSWGKGCIVETKKVPVSLEEASYQKNDTEKLLENVDFVTVAMGDLVRILTFQKSILGLFQIDCPDDRDCIRWLDTIYKCVSDSLKIRNTNLKAVSLNMEIRNENHLMSILPYFDSRYLETIRIIREGDKHSIWFDEHISTLEQWKRAKILTSDVAFSIPIECFLHFNHASFGMDTVTLSDMMKLKERIFSTPSSSLQYHINYRYIDEKPILDFLGPYNHGLWTPDLNWNFCIDNSEWAVEISLSKDEQYVSFITFPLNVPEEIANLRNWPV